MGLTEELEVVLNRTIQPIALEIKKTILDFDLTGIIQSGSWSNRNFIVLGYVSYHDDKFDHGKEIDLVFDIIQKADYVKFTAVVCKSTGEIEKDIFDEEIKLMSDEEIILKVEQIVKLNYKKIVNEYKNILTKFP